MIIFIYLLKTAGKHFKDYTGVPWLSHILYHADALILQALWSCTWGRQVLTPMCLIRRTYNMGCY